MNRHPGYRGFCEAVLAKHQVSLSLSGSVERKVCTCGAPVELCGMRVLARDFAIPIPGEQPIPEVRRYPRGGTA